MQKYENCVKSNGTINCEYEWDIFTQFYWPNLYTNEYEDIVGYERYQININSDMIIQPSFITQNGKLWAATHYIISGGYEDTWGFGYLIESFGRQYVPILYQSLLIGYSFVKIFIKDVFVFIEWINRHIFYLDVVSREEMTSISQLYSIFNFSNQSLYSIGHSISGTAFKGISYFTDIQGIAFEASESENNVNLLKLFEYKKTK